MKLLLTAVILLALGFRVQAQLPQYHAQVFGAEQGIGSGGILDVFMDRQQFLWVVNTGSLQRFDGRNVRTYPFEKTIYQALCDRENRVWVLSGRKIWRTRADREGLEPVAFDSTLGEPRAIFQLRDRPVCVLSTKGLYGWQSEPMQFERLPLSPPAPLAYTNLWRFDTCGTVIFYPGKACVYAYDLASDRTRALPMEGEIPFLHALTPDLAAVSNYSSGTFWYRFDRGVVEAIDPQRYRLSKGPGIVGITGAAPLGNGKYLMTTRIGIRVYDLYNDRFSREQIYTAGKPVELEDMLVRVFIDEKGTAWAHNVDQILAFTSLQNGIGLLRNHHYEGPRMWSNRVIGFAEDKAGNLWFGGAGGFKKLHLPTGEITTYPAVAGASDRLSHPSVRGVGFDGRYVVLGPTDKGVWLFDPRTERFRRPVYASAAVRHDSENDFIDQLTVLRNGDIVVCGRFHPYRIEAGTYRLDHIRFPGDNTNTNTALQDSLGRLWIGTHDGAYLLDAQYRLLKKIPTGTVYCLFEEKSGSMLVSTGKGLLRVRADDTHIDSFPQLGNNIVASILRDKRQRYWLATQNGLFLSDPGLKTLKKFDFADNIQGLVFNGGSGFAASNGMFFFSGINGINYFFPEKITLEDPPLTVSIQSVRLNDSDSIACWQPRQMLRLPYSNNTLSIGVAAPYYNNAGKLRFRYRLNDNATWINLGESNEIRLADMPAGDYRLEVAATVTGNVWYSVAQPLLFRIEPPFWQTWLFRLSAGLLLIGLLVGLIRFREKRLQQQQAAQLELEKLHNTNLSYQLQLAHTEEERQRALLESLENQRQAAEAKLQSMRLQMNPHFLFNALNSIQQMTMSGNGDGAALYLSKFSKLLRMVLTHSDHEQVPLRDEIAMLRLYIELESLRFDETFSWSINCAPELDQDDFRVPPLLLQPYVENAIWHGLLHKEGPRALDIYFENTLDERLRCTITDNGIGREAARALARTGAHTGKALRTGEERIRTLNQQYGQNNTIRIVDLYDPAGQATGTQVVIEMDFF